MWRKYQGYGLLFLAISTVYIILKIYLPFFLPVVATAFAILSPFIFAMFLAMLLEPLVELLHKKARLSRGLSTAVVVFGLVASIITLITALVAQLTVEIVALREYLPVFSKRLIKLLEDTIQQSMTLYRKGNVIYQDLPQQLHDSIEENLLALSAKLESLASSTVNNLVDFAKLLPGGITTGLTIIIVTLLATYFLLKDKDKVVRFWLEAIPRPYGSKILNVCSEIFGAFAKYLRAQLILITMTMIQAIIGLYIIDADYALTMGLLIGFMDLIPVLGPSSVFVPWIGWVLYQGNTPFAIKLLALYIIILVVRQVLETKVVADSLGLHPLATLLAMYVGLQLFGFIGLIAGPIAVIAIQAIAKSGIIKVQ